MKRLFIIAWDRRRTDTLENALHGLIIPKLLEKQGYAENNQERGQDGTQSTNHATGYSLQLIADKNAHVDRKNPGATLGYGHQVQKVFTAHPSVFVHHIRFNQRYHGISPAYGKQTYAEKRTETVPINIHIPTLTRDAQTAHGAAP